MSAALGSAKARAPTRRIPQRGRPPAPSASTPAADGQPTQQAHDAASLDVSRAVVATAYRSTPWAAEAAEEACGRTKARVLFVSESGVCRAPIAVAALQAALQNRGLESSVECMAAASRDYCLGEPPHPAVAPALLALGLPAVSAPARLFDDSTDLASHDLIVVFDKYTAADVLREVGPTAVAAAAQSRRFSGRGTQPPCAVAHPHPAIAHPQVSVYDTIAGADIGAGGYSRRVRRLGEFGPSAAASGDDGGISGGSSPDAQDIDDPLYGEDRGCRLKRQ